jgi:L-aspartate oxidase
MGSLAPRDIVARGIDFEMKRTGADCVYLDMTALNPGFLADRFPTILETCRGFGIDIRTEPIPVVPACHYFCGGVKVDLEGRTTLRGLYAVGEVACTGLHGANRLASNSLLEGLVFASRAAADAAREKHLGAGFIPAGVPAWNRGRARAPDEAVIVTQNWDEIRRFMWNYVGIVRTTRRLLRARRRIDMLMSEIVEYFWDYEVDNDIIELRNIAMVAKLVIESALRRTESRGLHYTLDYPETRGDLAVSTELGRRELEGPHWLRPRAG